MILITGGFSFTGINLAKYLLGLGEEVTLGYHRQSQVPDLLLPHVGKGLQVTHVDVAELTTIMTAIKKYKVTSIVHAASSHEGMGSLYQVVDTNVVGTANVLETARLMDVGRVTLISSEGINQGRKDRTPLKEEEFFWARSDRFIPVTKKMGELLSFIYQKEYKIDMVIVRPSRIYGPLYDAKRPIMQLVAAALKGGQSTFNEINENEGHDYVYVRDCARAIAMVHLAKKPKHAIYNIGLGIFHTLGDVARTLEKIVPEAVFKLGKGNFSSITSYVPKTEYDIETCLDISRIKEEFGYVPKYDLEKGLSALVAWVRDGSYS